MRKILTLVLLTLFCASCKPEAGKGNGGNGSTRESQSLVGSLTTLEEARAAFKELGYLSRQFVIISVYSQMNELDKKLKVDTPENAKWAMKVIALERKSLSEIAKEGEWLEMENLMKESSEIFVEFVRTADKDVFVSRNQAWEAKWRELLSSEANRNKGGGKMPEGEQEKISEIARVLGMHLVAGAKHLASGNGPPKFRSSTPVLSSSQVPPCR